jgi:hypothetical protein
VLGGAARVAGAGEGQAQPELRVVITGASVYDATEVAGRGGILAGVKLRSRERLEHAPGARFGSGSAFEQLGGRGRTPAAEQVEAAPVELMSIRTVGRGRIRSIL